MKKIVIVGRNLLPGGAERVIVQLANYFSKNGIDVTIITLDKYEEFFNLDTRINIVKIGKASDNKLVDKYIRYSKLRKLVNKIKPDSVLSLPEDVGIYVILALLGLRIPVYVSERNNPWVMPDVKITRILRWLMYPFAKGIVFQTEMAKSFFSKKIQKKGIVIANPVNKERIPDVYDGERENIIVGVGRLSPQKNFPLLIKAFYDFAKVKPDYSLIIYGEGDQRSELEELIKKLNLCEKVKLPGADQDVLNKIRKCKMFILSSDYEGMPNVLLETMCMGMPVVSTDCPSGGPRELIENHVNGILVEVNDRKMLNKAMMELTDNELACKYGKEASKLRNELTNDKIFLQWKDFLFSECGE